MQQLIRNNATWNSFEWNGIYTNIAIGCKRYDVKKDRKFEKWRLIFDALNNMKYLNMR